MYNAILEGYALVKLLLQAGANRNGVDAEGQTSLHIAAMKDDCKLVKVNVITCFFSLFYVK